MMQLTPLQIANGSLDAVLSLTGLESLLAGFLALVGVATGMLLREALRSENEAPVALRLVQSEPRPPRPRRTIAPLQEAAFDEAA